MTTRDLFQIKRDVEAGVYDYLAMDSDALGSLEFDLLRVQLLAVSRPKDRDVAAGSASEEAKTEKPE